MNSHTTGERPEGETRPNENGALPGAVGNPENFRAQSIANYSSYHLSRANAWLIGASAAEHAIALADTDPDALYAALVTLGDSSLKSFCRYVQNELEAKRG